MELPDISKRVRQLIKIETNGSVRAFAKKLNISQQKLNRIFNLDKKTGNYPTISLDVIMSITNIFVSINPEWLLTGNGDMTKRTNAKNTTKTSYTGNNINGSVKINTGNTKKTTHKQTESIQTNNTLQQENDKLQTKITYLQDQLKSKEELIAAKNETIEILRNK